MNVSVLAQPLSARPKYGLLRNVEALGIRKVMPTSGYRLYDNEHRKRFIDEPGIK